MKKVWGIWFVVGSIAVTTGCEDSPGTGGAGGTSSSSTSASSNASGVTSGTMSAGSTTGASGTTGATGSSSVSTGSIMMGNCQPSGSMSGANANCNALCTAILAPNCAEGPNDLQDCMDTCEGLFVTGQCKQFDNFIDCGGANATWSCSMGMSGVAPSMCAQQWQCIEALCFAQQD